jgi:hypothetical protein
MTGDIHTHAERRDATGTWRKIPDLIQLSWRSYGVHGWLADVRNHSAVPALAARRGLPSDISKEVARNYMGWEDFAHNMSWVGVPELVAFDYDATWEDRRNHHIHDADPWLTRLVAKSNRRQLRTFRELLGDAFFYDLELLQTAGAERVVFWFDS